MPWPDETIQNRGRVMPRMLIASGTMAASDLLVLVNASVGPVTYTLLPAAQMAGARVIIKKIDMSENAGTLKAANQELIDGFATQLLTMQWQAAEIYSDGATWYIIATV